MSRVIYFTVSGCQLLSKTFNVDLGNYYRTLKDIQIRKGGSKTHFLDELKYKLSEKLDEELTPLR